jgi:hypothetical protein
MSRYNRDHENPNLSQHWQPRPLAQGETCYLSSEVARGFTGVYFAMYATGNGRVNATPAFFDWFEYESPE